MTESNTTGAPPDGRAATNLDYEAALAKVMSLADFERSTHSPGHSTFHLERMALLLERLGDPHLGTPTVHVAGTKGKGSTAAMVTSILTSAGMSVGLYTSPHLHKAVERIRTGLDPVSPGEFTHLVDQTWPAVEWMERHSQYGPATTFELLTSMAFLHFKKSGLDFQVIEVGLGGRLDATNVVHPEACAITSISLDHTATLGDTVSLIAGEKAGIIKDGVPVVIAPQPEEAMSVFRQIADERDAPLVDVARVMAWTAGDSDLDGQSLELVSPRRRYDLWVPLLGIHQLENAATAVAVAEALEDRGYDVPERSIVEGIRDVRWSARLQVLSRGGPLVVVDGAHNPYSIKSLVASVRKLFEFDRLILIFGALGGHSSSGMMAELAALSPQVIAVESRNPRTAPSDIIARAARDNGLTLLFTSDNIADATGRALALAGENDMVLGAGSLFVAAEIIEMMEGIMPELYPNIKPPPRKPRGQVQS